MTLTLSKEEVPLSSSSKPFIAPPQISATHHTFNSGEISGFIRVINCLLKDNPRVQDKIPLNDFDPNSLFEAVKDGILFCELINIHVPGLIDLNKIYYYFKSSNNSTSDEKARLFRVLENHGAFLAAAKRLGGICLVNIGPVDLLSGTPYLVLGLVWQLLKRFSFLGVNLVRVPELGSTTAPTAIPEDILLAWLNHHLGLVNCTPVTNFSRDLSVVLV